VDEIDKIKHIANGEETSRLALVNMDWDKIKAIDILKVLGGFKPDAGIIKSVTITLLNSVKNVLLWKIFKVHLKKFSRIKD
jgi:hypothetical protein